MKKVNKNSLPLRCLFCGQTASSLRPYGRSGQIICIGGRGPFHCERLGCRIVWVVKQSVVIAWSPCVIVLSTNRFFVIRRCIFLQVPKLAHCIFFRVKRFLFHSKDVAVFHRQQSFDVLFGALVDASGQAELYGITNQLIDLDLSLYELISILEVSTPNLLIV